ncbi:MAG: shikimate dehydrogenase [Actinomycetota bacterium]
MSATRDPRDAPGKATSTVGVIGWPVDASLSPTIHNAAFRAAGLDWVYVPLPVAPHALPEALAGLAALGFAGANVTMPHKTEAASRMDSCTEDAELLRAVNTVVVGPEGLVGHNTDAPGFDRFLRDDLAFDPAGASALLYGAGGAARACALALVRAGADEVAVAVRDRGRAGDLEALVAALAGRARLVDLDGIAGERPDLVVNATPVGGAGDALPIPSLGPGTLVVDLLYRPAVTPLVAAAREAGAATAGGLGLLLHQAALAFELWTGQPPEIDVMSAAAVAALAERPA